MSTKALKKADAQNLPDPRDTQPKKSVKNNFTKSAIPVTQNNPLAHEFIDRRIVRLTGVVNDVQAHNIISQLHMLEALDPDADIELRINSPGGSVTAGLAILDAMKSLSCDVKTVCEGQAASMGAVLLAAGTPGKRFAMPHARIMIHSVSSGMEGTVIDMKIQLEEALRLNEVLADVLSDYSGINRKSVEDMMKRDKFMSAGEAKQLSLIDGVIQPKQDHRRRLTLAASNVVPLIPVVPVPKVHAVHGQFSLN